MSSLLGVALNRANRKAHKLAVAMRTRAEETTIVQKHSIRNSLLIALLLFANSEYVCAQDGEGEITQLAELPFKDSASQLAVSADGSIGALTSFDRETGETLIFSLPSLHVFARLPGPMFCVAISPDADFVAFGGEGQRTVVWERETNASVQVHDSLQKETSSYYYTWSLAFSPDGTSLTAAFGHDTSGSSCCFHSEAELVRFSTAEWHAPYITLLKRNNSIEDIEYSSDGRFLALATGYLFNTPGDPPCLISSASGFVTVDTSSGKMADTVTGEAQQAISTDGSQIGYVSKDCDTAHVILRDLGTDVILADIPAPDALDVQVLGNGLFAYRDKVKLSIFEASTLKRIYKAPLPWYTSNSFFALGDPRHMLLIESVSTPGRIVLRRDNYWGNSGEAVVDCSANEASSGMQVNFSVETTTDLPRHPALNVNGHRATFISQQDARHFEFVYTVRNNDPEGFAVVDVAGYADDGGFISASNSTLLFVLNDGVQSADLNSDMTIDLDELLRIIQFYNSLGIHCAEPGEASEDGYAPGPGGTSDCDVHDTDYAPHDWIISLDELLRAVQLYGSLSYRYCPDEVTEDGFCLGDAR